MKKIFLILGIVFISIITFLSCRKGDHDPYISLRSRHTRLIGEWKLTSLNFSIKRTKPATGAVFSTQTIEYSDSIKKSWDKQNNQTDTIYHEYLTIKDNGMFKLLMKSTIRNVVQTKSVTNQWYWLDTKKKKTGIMLNGYHSYDIDKLSSKELILIYEKVIPASRQTSNLEIYESYEATYTKIK